MRFALFAVTLLVASPLVALPLAASAPASGNEGLLNACLRSSATRPCEHAGVIPDTFVGANESRSYSEGNYRNEGTVTVGPGGEVEVKNATITHGSSSGGFVVLAGGTLVIQDSTLTTDTKSCFQVIAEAGSTLDMRWSTVAGGCGVEVETTQAIVDENLLREIPLALRLTGTNITVAGNEFLNNTISINQTDGEPTLTQNTFDGGEVCVQNWLTHPTIVNNVFRGCHVGIHHHRSHSVLSFNDMEDRSVPPGGGIVVQDTNSPVIEGNLIRNYGTGIIVINARAWIRNNTIADNVLDGIRVVNNSGPMDITNNTITGNGDDGIDLQGVLDVIVQANRISDNGGAGIVTTGGSRLILEDNDVRDNVGHGIQSATYAVVVRDNVAEYNGLTGIRIEAGADGAAIQQNVAEGNGQNGFYVAAFGVGLANNVATGNAHSGFVVEGANNVSFFDDNATGNAIDGFGLVDAGASGGSGLVAVGNGRHGFRLVGATGAFLSFPFSSGNAADGYHVNATELNLLSYSKAFSNGNAGVLNMAGNNTDARNGWFQGNTFAGVANLDQSVWIDARNSYWGSSDGPTTQQSNTGGDAVVGQVLYQPFSESPPFPPSFQFEDVA